MLKKVLCLLLVLACSVMLFACGGNGSSADLESGSQGNNEDKELTGGENGEGESDGKMPLGSSTKPDYTNDGAFFETIKNSAYNVITTKTETSHPVFGDSLTCVDLYRTIIYSSTHYEIICNQQLFSEIGAGGYIQQLPERTVAYIGGEYFVDGVKADYKPDEAAMQFKVDLNPQNLGNYTITDEKLTTKLTVAEAREVLGVTLNANGKIDFTVTTNGVALYKIEIDYKCGESSVHIETTHTFDPAYVEK